jgi:hypothetical protein
MEMFYVSITVEDFFFEKLVIYQAMSLLILSRQGVETSKDRRLFDLNKIINVIKEGICLLEQAMI